MRDCILKRVLLKMYYMGLDAKKKASDIYTELYIKYCPVNSRKIVFSNFFGRSFGENPKYIAEEILRQNLKLDLVWLVNEEGIEVPIGIRKVPYWTNAGKRELATAKVRVTNIRNDRFLPKRRGQVYLQTWHGGLDLKRHEREAEESLHRDYVTAARRDGAMCDAIISSCRLQSEDYRKNFWLSKDTEILEVGQPRCDTLFIKNKDIIIENVYRTLKLDLDTRLILYAPTFRDDGSFDAYALAYEKILDAFERYFNQECVLLVRLHPNASKLCNHIVYNDRIINASHYPDVHELYIASSVLITDYSNTAFDFALLGKPVFLCALDFEKYEKMRGFSIHYYNSPFIKSYSSAELIECINEFSLDEYSRKLEQYKNDVWKPFDDGHAAYRTVEWIKKRISQ